jgi:rhodanese-related sulfurtransferase
MVWTCVLSILIVLAADVPGQGPWPSAVRPPAAAPAQAPRMSLIEFSAAHRTGRVLVLDVRSVSAFRSGHIPGAVNVPLPEVESRTDDIRIRAMGRPVVAYCACAQEQTSALAAGLLIAAGLDARALAGGLDGWVARGGRIEK